MNNCFVCDEPCGQAMMCAACRVKEMPQRQPCEVCGDRAFWGPLFGWLCPDHAQAAHDTARFALAASAMMKGRA